jgi:SAM-dependent methyltransferase
MQVSGEETVATGTIRSGHGYVDPEYLQTIGAFVEQQKLRGYKLLRLEPGQRVLDLGCGPASDTINLAGWVGPSGMVVGVDHDPEMVAEANRRAQAAGVAGWTSHVEGDALALPFDAAVFDRVRSERVFQHLLHPAAAFGELVRVTKPGGVIFVVDTDWGTLSIDCSQIDLERRYVQFCTDAYLHNGYSGRRLYRLFVSHHLEDIGIEVFPVHSTSYPFTRYGILADQKEVAAVAAGALTPAEIDSLHKEWQAADAEGVFFATVSMVGIVGRKPCTYR